MSEPWERADTAQHKKIKILPIIKKGFQKIEQLGVVFLLSGVIYAAVARQVIKDCKFQEKTVK